MGYFQTWLLYHNALSSGVEIEDILKYARRNKEKANDDSELVIELKSQVAEQQKVINQILERDSKQTTVATTSKTSPILNGRVKGNNNVFIPPLNLNANSTTTTGGITSSLLSGKTAQRNYGSLEASANTTTFSSYRDGTNCSTKELPNMVRA